MTPIYYIDQKNWSTEDWYTLFRYLNRMLLNKNGERSEEIERLDASKMTNETKVMIKAILSERNVWSEWVEKYLWACECERTIVPMENNIIVYSPPLGLYKKMTEMSIIL